MTTPPDAPLVRTTHHVHFWHSNPSIPQGHQAHPSHAEIP